MLIGARPWGQTTGGTEGQARLWVPASGRWGLGFRLHPEMSTGEATS